MPLAVGWGWISSRWERNRRDVFEGELISEEEYRAHEHEWLLVPADNDYLLSIMKPVYEPGKFANWIAPPLRGIEGQPQEFEYVRL